MSLCQMPLSSASGSGEPIGAAAHVERVQPLHVPHRRARLLFGPREDVERSGRRVDDRRRRDADLRRDERAPRILGRHGRLAGSDQAATPQWFGGTSGGIEGIDAVVLRRAPVRALSYCEVSTRTEGRRPISTRRVGDRAAAAVPRRRRPKADTPDEL